VLAFDPYRLGWKSYLYCLGIATVTPFLIEEIIERWNIMGLVKTLATLGGVAALLSLIFLAMIRGDLLAHEIETTNQAVVIDDTVSTAQAEPQNNFYRDTVVLLRLAMALLAVAMELGAGLALHKAWGTTENSGEDWKELRKELRDVRGQMVLLATEMKLLQNEPAIFVTRFWRNFYHAMLTHAVRNAMAKLLFGILIILLPGLHAHAATPEQADYRRRYRSVAISRGHRPRCPNRFREEHRGDSKPLDAGAGLVACGHPRHYGQEFRPTLYIALGQGS
jgi:hypothetical protein